MKAFVCDLFYSIQDKFFQTNEFDIIHVTGSDATRFLQGQITQDISKVSSEEGLISCRLNRTGKMMSSFYIWGDAQNFTILISKKLSESLVDDLNKYIIMEDVQLDLIVIETAYFVFTQKPIENSVELPLFGQKAKLLLDESLTTSFSQLSQKDVKQLEFVSTWPKNFGAEEVNVLVNNSLFNSLGVNYDKGCFLGQETAAKVENNRGAAKKVVIYRMDSVESINFDTKLMYDEKELKVIDLLKTNEASYISLRVGRELMVQGKSYCFHSDTEKFIAQCCEPATYGDLSKEAFAEILYDRALELFHEEKYKLSANYLELVLQLNQDFDDAYEIIGVIYGRLENFPTAIKWMDKLLDRDPNSVMAHTNKSLYFMKMGEIEKAEEEKALATIASFEENGKIAEQKKREEEKKKKDVEDLLSREKMFEQVLEIDPDDQLANYGLADIAFSNEDFDKAKNYLEKVLNIDENYSVAYLKLGETFLALNESLKAKEIFEKGINIAVKRGDMMPANKMQTLLHKI